MDATLTVTDPTEGHTSSLLARIATPMIHDPRDLPFVSLTLWASATLVPMAFLLFVPGVFRWWMAPLYLAFNGLVFLDRYILMLHNTSHRPLFISKYRLLNSYVPRFLGPFFGETPETYYCHHMGMHHPENNLRTDLSTTMQFERDNPLHFARYFFRFIFMVWLELPIYLWRKGRRRMALRSFFGEVGAWGLYAVLALINWQAALTVFIFPLFLVRFLMMAGNWGQHAFIDGARPANCYVNSITCINTRYNRRCFNDGYHIGHHVKANRHWTELPGDFLANRERYAQEGAIVFSGIDFFQVWLYLMLGRYNWLAKHYVNLDGQQRPTSEIIALLKSRTRPIPA